MNYNISCSEPDLILNPKIVDIALKCPRYHFRGCYHDIVPEMRYDLISGENPCKVLGLPYLNKDYDKVRHCCSLGYDPFLDDSFFLTNDGEIIDIWIFVPCGKCDCCLSKKMASYVQRSQFAVQESGEVAFNVRLSYNERHLPGYYDYDGNFLICHDKKHIQLFQKRLKVTVSRLWRLYCPGKFKDESQEDYSARLIESKQYWSDAAKKIKFIYSGEYGSKEGSEHLPHWHVIIFGLPTFKTPAGVLSVSFDTVMREHLINYAWRDPVRKKNGLFESFQEYRVKYPLVFNRPKGYDPYSYGYIYEKEVDGVQAVSYCLKYAFKHYSSGLDSIYGCSQNLGVKFVEQHLDEVLRSPDHKLVFRDFISKNPTSVSLCTYYLNKFFPSESKLIPCEFRQAYRDFQYLCTFIEHLPYRLFPKNLRHYVYQMSDFVSRKYPWMNFTVFSTVKRTFYGPDFAPPADFWIDQTCNDFFMSESPDFFELQLECSDFSDSVQRTLHYPSTYIEMFAQLEQSYKVLLKYDLDYKEIERKLNLRNDFFSSFPKRTRSEVLQSGIDFAEEMAHYRAISTF